MKLGLWGDLSQRGLVLETIRRYTKEGKACFVFQEGQSYIKRDILRYGGTYQAFTADTPDLFFVHCPIIICFDNNPSLSPHWFDMECWKEEGKEVIWI